DDETVAFLIDLSNPRGDLALKGFHIDDLIERGRLSLRMPPDWFWLHDNETLDRRGRLDRICLGEFVNDQVTVREAEQNSLGLSLLSRYIVTFDFPKGRLYLKKGSRFAEPQRSDLSGLTVMRLDGETRVQLVRPNSPADTSGLQDKDQILTVEGKSAGSLSLFELRTLLMTAGPRIRLDVTGPAGRRRVELQLPQTEVTALIPAASALSANDDEAANMHDFAKTALRPSGRKRRRHCKS
ncbi:MAG TPA: hypothetical protein VGH74_19110, partial [Planctomycetaceae bacterium]